MIDVLQMLAVIWHFLFAIVVAVCVLVTAVLAAGIVACGGFVLLNSAIYHWQKWQERTS